MKVSSFILLAVVLGLSSLQMGMSRRGQYDEEARLEERENKSNHKGFTNPASGIAEGVKTATVDSTTGFLSETRDSTEEGKPVVGTLEGARKGTGVILDNTVKGALKVATLGQGDVEHYEVKDPEKNSDETTKITLKIPGT